MAGGRDGGFATFAADALPGLLRYGHLLTGSSERAVGLVGSTLRRAAVDWQDGDDPPALTGEIRASMAQESAGGAGPPGRVDAAPPGLDAASARIWRALGRLSARERAVIVLRHGDGMTDARIGRTIGAGVHTAADVAGYATSVLADADIEPDTLPRAIRALLEDPAVDLPPTLVDVDTLLPARRGRRVLVAISVAVVALGLAVVGAVDRLNDRDDSAAGQNESAGAAASQAARPPMPTPTPSPTVDPADLAVFTPDDFGVLRLGMPLAELEAVEGVEIAELENNSCHARFTIGDLYRGVVQLWPPLKGPPGSVAPPDGATLVVTAMQYFGDDARTPTDVYVGQSSTSVTARLQAAGDDAAVDSAIGPAATIFSATADLKVMSIGYDRLRCTVFLPP